MRGPSMPVSPCSLTGCRCLLCNKCSTLLLSQSLPMLLLLGGSLPHPLTANVLMLFFVDGINLDSGHRLCHLTFILLRICVQQPTTNFLLNCDIVEPHITCISPTTIYCVTTIRPQTAYTLLSSLLLSPL